MKKLLITVLVAVALGPVGCATTAAPTGVVVGKQYDPPRHQLWYPGGKRKDVKIPAAYWLVVEQDGGGTRNAVVTREQFEAAEVGDRYP